MPVYLRATSATSGDASWEDTSGLGGGGIPLGVQEGFISATNESGDGTTVSSGFIVSTAVASTTQTLVTDVGGVGMDIDSNGSGTGFTYINGGSNEVTGSGGIIRNEQRPVFEHRFKMSTVAANGRFFVGFYPAETTAAASASDDPSALYFGLQYSPDSRGDTTFQLAGKSTGAGTQVLVDTGVAPSSTAIYRLVIIANTTTSWVATLYQDGTGTPDYTTTQLFTTTVTNTNAIPAVGSGFTVNISYSETAASAVSFTHYYVKVWIRSGVQISTV